MLATKKSFGSHSLMSMGKTRNSSPVISDSLEEHPRHLKLILDLTRNLMKAGQLSQSETKTIPVNNPSLSRQIETQLPNLHCHQTSNKKITTSLWLYSYKKKKRSVTVQKSQDEEGKPNSVNNSSNSKVEKIPTSQ